MNDSEDFYIQSLSLPGWGDPDSADIGNSFFSHGRHKDAGIDAVSAAEIIGSFPAIRTCRSNVCVGLIESDSRDYDLAILQG